MPDGNERKRSVSGVQSHAAEEAVSAAHPAVFWRVGGFALSSEFK